MADELALRFLLTNHYVKGQQECSNQIMINADACLLAYTVLKEIQFGISLKLHIKT